MKNYCLRFALYLLFAVQVAPTQAQGVEMSITKTIDILAGRPRPLAGQTNYQVQTTFNTTDGGSLTLAQLSDPPNPYLVARFAADGTVIKSQHLTNFAIVPDTTAEDDSGNLVFCGTQGNGPVKFFQIAPDGSVLNQLPVDLYFSHLIRYQGGFLAAATGWRDESFVFLKFSTNLVVEWERRIPVISLTYGYARPPLDVLLAGPAGDFLFSASGALVRMNTNGAVVWAKSLANERISRVLRTRDGGYLIANSERANGANPSDSDYHIVKATAGGDYQWARWLGGLGPQQSESLRDVTATEDGGFLLYGHSTSEEISGTKGVQGVGAWLVKTDERGLKQGEMMIPEGYASWLIRAGSGFALVGSKQNGQGIWNTYRAELSVNRRARISAHSLTGQPFNIDVSTDLATWSPVVVGFSGDLEFRELLGSGNRFWRALRSARPAMKRVFRTPARLVELAKAMRLKQPPS